MKELQLMAGSFALTRDTNYFLEFNVKFDIPAAQKVAKEWPTPMIWSGAEIGDAVLFPALVVERDFGYVKHHPIYECYQLFRATPHERPCFDLTSVLQAVWPDRGYFDLSVTGKVEIMPDSFSKFIPEKQSKAKRDRFLIVDKDQAKRVRELFAALITEAPAARP
ncbi:MAG: hypothetical protein NVV74_10215 [Magnetospirillum sp.]|nr:hypothetical protein [Magnetospirillum sp.]